MCVVGIPVESVFNDFDGGSLYVYQDQIMKYFNRIPKNFIKKNSNL
jgi:hypothetical protein